MDEAEKKQKKDARQNPPGGGGEDVGRTSQTLSRRPNGKCKATTLVALIKT
jgi:hypothetical protein